MTDGYQTDTPRVGAAGALAFIALDHHATTAVAPEVVDAMLPFFTAEPWNAHSSHGGGDRAAAAVAAARCEVAALIGAGSSEVVFTSGATEANTRAFERALADAGVHAKLNGAREPRLPGSLNLRVSGASADDVVARLAYRVLLSTGSACMSGEIQGSYVLAALGLGPIDVAASFRLCFDCTNTMEEAVAAAKLRAEMIAACSIAAGGDVQ